MGFASFEQPALAKASSGGRQGKQQRKPCWCVEECRAWPAAEAVSRAAPAATGRVTSSLYVGHKAAFTCDCHQSNNSRESLLHLTQSHSSSHTLRGVLHLQTWGGGDVPQRTKPALDSLENKSARAGAGFRVRDANSSPFRLLCLSRKLCSPSSSASHQALSLWKTCF